MNKIRKFKKMNEEIIDLNQPIKKYGIVENQDNLYELVSQNNKNAFMLVDVIYDNGIYYVDFNETSKWADSNIVIGQIL